MKIISPIAIDMGAKNTGVYYAKYPQGSNFEQLEEKHGEVLVYRNYTGLLRERTANRHTRRGYQRKKLAKRLLVLVLENRFNFLAKKHTQAIGFLLNRRGFTFLEEEYSKENLNRLQGVWDNFSSNVTEIIGDSCEVAENLMELAIDDHNKIKNLFEEIKGCDGFKKNEKIKKDLLYYGYVIKIAEKCDVRIENDGNKVPEDKKLSNTSEWIVKRLVEAGVTAMQPAITGRYQINLLDYIDSLNSQEAEKLKAQLPDIETKQKSAKEYQKTSIWNFKINEFDLERELESLDDEDKQYHQRSLLHNFCYAVYKIKHELESGSRHRLGYFKEIKNDLEKFTSDRFLADKNSPYLKKFAKEIKNHPTLDIEKLSNLVFHISNFELKPLRAYFNNKTPTQKGRKEFINHCGGDEWNLEKLSRIASQWFMKNWTVNKEKDGDKKVCEYNELRNAWKEHIEKNDKNNIIDFWLKTLPVLTIPPYQSMTNRRPPKCQSLLLNPKYLDKNYSKWKSWLKQLNPDANYKKKLQNLQSGKGTRKNCDGRLISDQLIQSRQLQFILDVSKKVDSFNLNQIWSVHHKLQQLEREQGNEKERKECSEKLEQEKDNSKLPQTLKEDLDFKKCGSFAHFINQYYIARRQARCGRYFIHQTNKNNWIEDKLFTICPHKPRQKRHQMLTDLAAILGVDVDALKNIIEKESEQAEKWFSDISSFKTTCAKSSKAQKKYRGSLKIKIDYACKEKAKIIGTKKKLGEEEKELANLAGKCEELALKLAKKLWDQLPADKQKANAEKFNTVFSFAQINNILFKDRSGFSNTCPVCSTDNGFRMQSQSAEQGMARASRLPALSIRLLDGVVMRICEVVSRHIANTRWNSIKDDLINGKKVSIPLILEQNRFEFEPALKKLKGNKPSSEEDNRDNEYDRKENRIKNATGRICPYSGESLGEHGEIDHIIPQASVYGTLNDEANLIYVSNFANQGKGNQSKFLQELAKNYKAAMFPDAADDAEIRDFIYEQLEASAGEVDEEGHFKFGAYLSFINLSADQQKAFRHALFLKDDPLREKVIKVLQNRNRAIVNGTQRYMAQCIADKLHKIAKREGKEKQIEFDYFEYPANRIHELRKFYEKFYGDIKKPKNQTPYSHLIDAHLVFLLAAEAHKNSGSMGLCFDKLETITQGIYSKEILPTKFFDLSCVSEQDFLQKFLDRNKSKTGVRIHRSFHRPNFYAQNYAPLFIGKKGDQITVKAGFDWSNRSVEVPKKWEKSDILSTLKFAKDEYIANWNSTDKTLSDLHEHFNKKIWYDDTEVFYIAWNKQKIHQYFVSEFSSKHIADGIHWDKVVSFFDKLSYQVKKEKIEKYENITEVLKKYSNFEIKLFNQQVTIPAKDEWLRLQCRWDKAKSENSLLTDGRFLRDYFKITQNKNNQHQKVRKVFSLPVANELGHFLQKRTSWNGNDIYQIAADSDSREDGNKFSRKVKVNDGTLKEAINKPFISENMFKLKEEENIVTDRNYTDINPNEWIGIEQNDDFPSKVKKIEYKIDNTTRPQIKIHLTGVITVADIKEILNNPLTKAKDRKKLDATKLDTDVSQVIEYTASGFNKDIKKRLREVMTK